MHDGAVIITGEKVMAARCVLPVIENDTFPSHLGMRHRAAAGITENTDCLAIIVSEERGKISIAKNGELEIDLSSEQLKKKDYKKNFTSFFSSEIFIKSSKGIPKCCIDNFTVSDNSC